MAALTRPRRIYAAVAHRDPYVAAGIASLLRSRVDFVVRTGTTDIDDGDDTIDVFVTDYATGLRKLGEPSRAEPDGGDRRGIPPRPAAGGGVVTAAATVCIRMCHGDPLAMAGLVSLIGREPGFQVQAGPGADEGIVDVTRLDKEGEVMQAIDSRAHACLRQDAPPAELMDAIRHVARGGALYLCQRTAALFQAGPAAAVLTAREDDVLSFLARGDCNKGIARQLDISTSTAKAHVSRICEKLHASSRVQVAVNATRRGLLRR